MSLINWSEQFKIRVTSHDIKRDKHEVVKLLLLRKLIRKHKREKQYIRIYTEFEVSEGIICDLYFENIKDKSKYAYEIQKDMKKSVINKKLEKYKEWDDMYFTTNLVIIDLNKLSDDIKEIEKQLEEYIY